MNGDADAPVHRRTLLRAHVALAGAQTLHDFMAAASPFAVRAGTADEPATFADYLKQVES